MAGESPKPNPHSLRNDTRRHTAAASRSLHICAEDKVFSCQFTCVPLLEMRSLLSTWGAFSGLSEHQFVSVGGEQSVAETVIKEIAWTYLDYLLYIHNFLN